MACLAGQRLARFVTARLKAAGLVAVRKEGRQRFYQASKDDMGALAVVLESFWSDRMNALQTLAERREREIRPGAPEQSPITRSRSP